MLAKLKAWATSPAFNTVRAVIYAAVPAVLGALVTAGKLSQDHAALWSAVGVAFFGPALAAVFAPNGWRTWLFGLVAPVQALLVGLGGANNVVAAVVAAVLTSIVSSGVAASNVHHVTPAKLPAPRKEAA
ncbi:MULTISPECIES: phage holin [Mycobacterium avium complex (MAC)]|uniref:Holin n=1 Tax=Mycobacterium timonense TaxID=701043 RepID=A0ABX3TSH3_9MYCO|nr:MULTISPECIES: hypothetical protein [Mycobacterium avium complex (MAC)]ETB35830.1 hypothetical protein N602_25880 [Mycobacterium avium subsp. hominissuis 10-5606]MBZ4500202.1 hypothetical protein [Mycobacterium avium subsp. hominissuis]MBZ4547733.1 hypothetical protein [Mycobacterium avium subsp. hominissuis]MBZ4600382.1 hypothetical protein [Mycobacterium avium subsp. hominissuis]MDO2381989.1 hypothetical protein [Mycobacterium avium subsp. hominissuis]